MPRPTKHHPERGSARTRLLDAAIDLVRRQGFAATSVEGLCAAAEVTKGAYFHHFPTKEALGAATAERWSEVTAPLFAQAPYHAPGDPLERLLAYVAFRKSLIGTELAQFSCLAGTMVQETFERHPPIRAACGASIRAHAETLVPDIEAAMARAAHRPAWSATGLALHIQAVIQGAFVLAKATGDPETARASLDHLAEYIALALSPTSPKETSDA